MKRLILAPILALMGCGPTPWMNRVQDMSKAAAPSVSRLSDVYTTVSSEHVKAQESRSLSDFSTYQPGQVKNLIEANDMAERQAAIKALSSYLSLVAYVATDKDVTNPSALQSTFTYEASSSLTEQQLGLGLYSLDKITKMYVGHISRKRLPKIVIQADPLVQTLCAGLISDLSILEKQYDSDSNLVLTEQYRFITRSAQSAYDDRTSKRTLFSEEETNAQEHIDIETLKTVLTTFASTHKALAQEYKNGHTK